LTPRRTLAAFAIAAALAGCGDPNDPPTTTTPPPPPPVQRETVDRVPHLPQRWGRFISHRGGFAIGLPPGWIFHSMGQTALVRSYDHLVAISISAERRPAALDDPLREYAKATASALGGFRGAVHVRSVRSFDHRYDAVEVRARGTAKGGVTQRVSVIVLRRDHAAMLTAVIAANVKRSADPSLRLARRILDTLRTRPPAGSGS
jgi:hypothetical protein